MNTRLGKAGRNRCLGKRPRVRGVAMCYFKFNSMVNISIYKLLKMLFFDYFYTYNF